MLRIDHEYPPLQLGGHPVTFNSYLQDNVLVVYKCKLYKHYSVGMVVYLELAESLPRWEGVLPWETNRESRDG